MRNQTSYMFSILAVVLSLAASAAAQNSVPQIEERIRQLRQMRGLAEQDIFKTTERIGGNNARKTELQEIVSSTKVPAERLAGYEQSLADKRAAVQKSREDQVRALWDGLVFLRRPQTHLPEFFVALWDDLSNTRWGESAERKRINAELQQSVPIDDAGHTRRFNDLAEFARFAAEAKLKCDMAQADLKDLDRKMDALKANLLRLQARSEELRIAIDRALRDLELARDARTEPPPVVPVTTRPSRPPDNVASPINVWFPREEDLAKGLKSGVDSREVYIYVLGIDARVPVPKEGSYRLHITIDTVGQRYLWANVKAGGARQAVFRGNVPLPIGDFVATLDVPELPQIAPRLIKSRMLPFQRRDRDWLQVQVDEIAKAKVKFERARPQDKEYYKAEIGTNILAMATEYLVLGRPSQTVALCQTAAPYLPRKTSLGAGTGYGQADLGRVHTVLAAAAFQTGDAAAYKKAMSDHAALCIATADREQSRQIRSQQYAAAAGLNLEMARRLLILGAKPAEARSLAEAANRLYRQGGYTPDALDWLPTDVP